MERFHQLIKNKPYSFAIYLLSCRLCTWRNFATNFPLSVSYLLLLDSFVQKMSDLSLRRTSQDLGVALRVSRLPPKLTIYNAATHVTGPPRDTWSVRWLSMMDYLSLLSFFPDVCCAWFYSGAFLYILEPSILLYEYYYSLKKVEVCRQGFHWHCYLLTYKLTISISQLLSWSRNSPPLMELKGSTRYHSWSVPWTPWNQSTLLSLIHLRYVLIFISHLRLVPSSCSFPQAVRLCCIQF